MKRFTLRSVLAIALALLLVCSLFPAASADSEGPVDRPVIRHEDSWPATADESGAGSAESELLRDSQTFRLHAEEELWANVGSSVTDKVDEIVAECRAAGVTGEYETALWLHDWLINHATYDKSLSIYTPDGVLLQGRGVCQSYRTAYQLLLDKVGIENTYISSSGMNHTWNVVKIDGVWCHIDVTWDDPTSSNAADDPIVSGMECHTYFGMTDALIQLDHSWSAAEEPGVLPADSLQNYYPLRNGYVCYTNDAELDEQLCAKAANKESPIEIMYVGTDSTRSAYNDFKAWYSENGASYGMQGYSASFGSFSCTINTSYGEVISYPSGELVPPRAAPAFTLSGPDGSSALADFQGSGLLMIFGRTTCGNTLSLLERLYSSLPDLKAAGVEVLAALTDAGQASDLSEMMQSWPDYRYCYGGNSDMWSYLRTANSDLHSVTFPAVFVVNPVGEISYYSTGPVRSVKALKAEALAAAPALPTPEPTCDLEKLTDGSVRRALQSACADGKTVCFVTDDSMSAAVSASLQSWEAHAPLFDSLNWACLACVSTVSADEKAAYPHVSFVDGDSSVNHTLELLRAAGLNPGSYSARNGFVITPDGNIAAYSAGSLPDMVDRARGELKALSFDAALPAGTEALEESAFESTGFTALDLSGGWLRSIGERAFAGSESLRFVKLPASVSSIAPSAFTGSPNVTLICPAGSEALRLADAYGLCCITP